MIGMTCGRIWRNRITGVLWPIKREDRTNGLSLMVNTWARTIRASVSHSTKPNPIKSSSNRA